MLQYFAIKINRYLHIMYFKFNNEYVCYMKQIISRINTRQESLLYNIVLNRQFLYLMNSFILYVVYVSSSLICICLFVNVVTKYLCLYACSVEYQPQSSYI